MSVVRRLTTSATTWLPVLALRLLAERMNTTSTTSLCLGDGVPHGGGLRPLGEMAVMNNDGVPLAMTSEIVAMLIGSMQGPRPASYRYTLSQLPQGSCTPGQEVCCGLTSFP